VTGKLNKLKNIVWISLISVWTLLLLLSLWNQIRVSEQGIMELAKLEAHGTYSKDLVYRRWAASHGGVYVPPTEEYPANPYLSHIPDRDIITESGKKLTLVNPAYMTRQVHELPSNQYGVRGHITSLNPLRPQNAPDDWERKQLQLFEQEPQVVEAIIGNGADQYLRMMFPMITEVRCLKCHAQQGYKVGQIRGGISVSLPMTSYLEAHADNIRSITISNASIWVLGLVVIFFMRRYVNQQFTLQSQIRRTAQESEQRFRALFENALYGSGVADYETGTLLDCNKVFCDMTGYRKEELIGQPQRMIHPVSDENDPYSESYSKHRQVVDGTTLETQIVTKGGELRDVEIKANHLELDGRQVLLGYFNDITHQKAATNALQQSEQKFSKAFDYAPLMITISKLEDGTYIDANARFFEVTGFTREEVIGKRSVELNLVSAQTRARIIAALNKDGRVTAMELPVLSKDGTRRKCSYFGEIFEVDGEQKLLSLALDITEQSELESRLRQVEKMDSIGQLAGGVAHDFNNQLSGIMGYAELLRLQLKDAEFQPLIDNIITCAKNSADLTRKLLTFSRKGPLLKESINIHKTLSDVIGILKHSIDKRISIRQNLLAAETSIVGDTSQIQNAFLNLAINARDAISDRGEIVFETDVLHMAPAACREIAMDLQPGDYIKIDVCDNGVGMTEAIREKIFEPFFTTKEKGQGTGMGLAAVYGTVKSHSGGISVVSQIDVGTTFSVYLPLEKKEEEKSSDQQIDGSSLAGVQVLIIDDEENVRNVSRQILELCDCRVHTEPDGIKGVAYYQEHVQSLDLVILDLILPLSSGEDVFRAIRAINPKATVLLASGFSTQNAVEELLAEGAAGFLPKPYSQAELLRAIQQALKLNAPQKKPAIQ